MSEEYQEPTIDNKVAEQMARAERPAQSAQYDKIIQEEKVSNFISQTSPSRSLIKIDWMLKGFMFDEIKREWIKVTTGVPDNIRMDFIQSLAPHLTEDVRMTRLDRGQINGIMAFCIEWVADYLDINADTNNMNEDQMTKVGLIILSATFYALARAENGIERDKMYNSLKMGDSLNDYAQQEVKKSLLDSFLPWK